MPDFQLKQKLIDEVKSYIDEQRIVFIDNACNILAENFIDKKNEFGVSLVQESIEIAIIASKETGLGISSIISTLLFRPYLEGVIDDKFILNNFPEFIHSQVITIIKGIVEVNKLDNKSVFGLEQLNFKEKYQHLTKRSKKFAVDENTYLKEQGEYFKHFYITIGKDIRVLLLKFAYHYYKTLNIKDFDEKHRLILARESRYLYAPLAHQLGLYNIKTYLEETAMKYLNSDIYREIAEKLAQTKASRDKYIADFIEPIKKSIDELNLKTQIKGRPKSIHSIWNKMKKQGVGIDKIYDLFAVRVILTDNFDNVQQEKAACWNVYSKITDVWVPNPKRLRDWVSNPKSSGYESLHATVIGPEGKWVEVQIRTKRMDEIAEKGSAAHWKYKEVKENRISGIWLDEIKNIIQNQDTQVYKNATEDDENKKAAKDELYSDTIYVFTPKGELKKLKSGATVLDFAYQIHTSVGDRCTGAKIKNKLVGIRHKLINGDIVEIITSSSQSPREEWLDIVVTNNARTRIKRALKFFENEKIEQGKQIFAEIIEKVKSKYKTDFDFNDKKLNILRKKFGLTKIADFYLQIAENQLNINEDKIYEIFILPAKTNFENALEKLQSLIEISKSKKDNDTEDFLIIDQKLSNIKFEFAKCCNPIPGDNIFAFVTATKGTKIHKIDCKNAPDLFKNYPYRIIKAKWKHQETDTKFKAKLKLVSEQKPGIVNQISSVILKQPFIELYEINIKESQNQNYEGSIGVLVNGIKHLEQLINKLAAINGIISITRDDNL